MRAALLCLLLTGCALLPAGGDRRNPMAIYDAYLIAHGMAISYDERLDADPAVSHELATLDARAHRALLDLARGQTGDPDQSARAVAALSDFASRQTNPTR